MQGLYQKWIQIDYSAGCGLQVAGCGLRAIYDCCLVIRSLHKKTEMIKFILFFFVLCIIHQQNMIIEYMHMYVCMKLIDSKIAMP